MTSVRASTQTAPSGHFVSRTEPGVDTDVPDMLRAWLGQQHKLSIVPIQPDTVFDYQAQGTYRRNDQTSTHDVGMDTARTMYQTHSTSSMDTHRYLMHDRVLGQQHFDIEISTRMDDAEIINKLDAEGFVNFAERLRYLYDVTGEDEEGIKLDSLRGFATFAIKNRGMHPPQITITADGLIQAVWKHPRQGTLVMDFQESGDIAFTLLYGRWDQETKRRKLIGELPSDQAMRHVGDFMRKIRGT